MAKLKILWVGDSPTVDTGFGVVSKSVLNELSKKGYEIDVLGVNHYGEYYDQSQFPYRIHPCEKGGPEQVYGIHRLWQMVEQLRPDVLFFLNDPWIIKSYMDVKPPQLRTAYMKTAAYYPTDGGPIKHEWLENLNSLDAQICYSKYAEGIVKISNGGTRPANLHQVYHGVDTSTYYPINQHLARVQLGLPTDLFIVGMVARNQPRKRFDILIKAFAEFARDKPEAKLYLHTALKDLGYDLTDLVKQFGISDRLIMTKDVTPAHGVSPERLNLIYNAFDVNALISLGDGFGLPVAESMAVGCPQIVSDHSCLGELVKGHGGMTVKTGAWVLNSGGINTWGGITDVEDLTKKLNLMYSNTELRAKYSEDAFNFITDEQFTWKYAGNKFDKIIKDMFHLLKTQGE